MGDGELGQLPACLAWMGLTEFYKFRICLLYALLTTLRRHIEVSNLDRESYGSNQVIHKKKIGRQQPIRALSATGPSVRCHEGARNKNAARLPVQNSPEGNQGYILLVFLLPQVSPSTISSYDLVIMSSALCRAMLIFVSRRLLFVPRCTILYPQDPNRVYK